ncbi:MAG: methyltransferase domain-containing protein [Phycisphaerales bacterium]|nr:MAG: methyltransferase domain-containing protein [Phycisphaerales bacterium]
MSYWDAFFKLHSDLPREGPGSDEATAEALRRLPALPDSPRVLDVGCGPGRQTLVLARKLQTPVVAVDMHEPYLDQLRASAQKAGLTDLVIAHPGRMEALEEEPGSIDLIWSEGAIYIVGFVEGLKLWRPLLRTSGLVVVTEATWLTENPSAEVEAFWGAAYPAMTDVDGNIRNAAAAGFEVFDHFALPSSAWWNEYLTPLEERAAKLRVEAAGDPELTQVLEEHDREADICRRFGDTFGYVFYLMRKAN